MIKEVWETFKEAKNIVIVSPAPPDVDSICSCLLLDKLFSHRGMGIPRPHQFFCAQKPTARDNTLLKFVEPKLDLFFSTLPTEYIMPLLIVIVDYGSFNTCGITPREMPYHYFIGLDEHPGPIEDFPINGIQLCDPRMPSTTALIYEMFRQKCFPITQEIATYVALGIMADTGRMTNSKANVHAFRIMTDCLNKGILWEEIQEAAAPKMTPQRLEVWIKAKEYLNYQTNFVSLIVYKKTLTAWGGTKKDIETFFGTYMCALEGIDIAVLIYEQDDGTWKISFRSKGKRNNQAAELAKKFGGGGHSNAAIAIYQGVPFDAERMTISFLQE